MGWGGGAGVPGWGLWEKWVIEKEEVDEEEEGGGRRRGAIRKMKGKPLRGSWSSSQSAEH